jgi:hypothetical protein
MVSRDKTRSSVIAVAIVPVRARMRVIVAAEAPLRRFTATAHSCDRHTLVCWFASTAACRFNGLVRTHGSMLATGACGVSLSATSRVVHLTHILRRLHSLAPLSFVSLFCRMANVCRCLSANLSPDRQASLDSAPDRATSNGQAHTSKVRRLVVSWKVNRAQARNALAPGVFDVASLIDCPPVFPTLCSFCCASCIAQPEPTPGCGSAAIKRGMVRCAHREFFPFLLTAAGTSRRGRLQTIGA